MPRRSGHRVQLSVRLSESDKDYFGAQAEAAGLEPSVAIRQILELVIQRMRTGRDFLDAVHELKTAWGVPAQSEIDRRIAAAQKALSELNSRDDQVALLDTIEQFGRTRRSTHV